jgi:membrane protein YqaA with SNARE-associated domain
MGDLALLGAAFAFGIGSGILPVFLNAEVYVVGMGAFVPKSLLVVTILSLGVGTVIGKAIVFELVRRGSSRVRQTVERKPPRNAFTATMRSVGDRLLKLLDRPYLGAATVLASSSLAVPPLAVVTILAGASRQPRWLFLLMVFVGRTSQFLAIAFLVHGVT